MTIFKNNDQWAILPVIGVIWETERRQLPDRIALVTHVALALAWGKWGVNIKLFDLYRK